jgi:uncharacterized membrane protein YkvA (DUF1232 family)
MSDKKQGYEINYSEPAFWEKALAFGKSAGADVIEKALWLFYASLSPATPKWAKRVIYGALGYFIFPLDAIPDPALLVGFADDLGVLAAAIATVAMYITDDVKAQAARKMEQWFGK